MTIYTFELKSGLLEEINSSYVIVNLCNEVCERLFTYFLDELLVGSPEAQWEFETQLGVILWNLELLKREIVNDVSLQVDWSVEVKDFRIKQRAFLGTPELDHELSWDFLSTAHPQVLLDFLTKLIGESMKCLFPHLTDMPIERFEACEHALDMADQNLRREMLQFLEEREMNFPYLSTLETFEAQIRMEVFDLSPEIIFLGSIFPNGENDDPSSFC